MTESRTGGRCDLSTGWGGVGFGLRCDAVRYQMRALPQPVAPKPAEKAAEPAVAAQPAAEPEQATATPTTKPKTSTRGRKPKPKPQAAAHAAA